MTSIVLGTSSPIRQQLFKRLQLAHEVVHPDIDETAFENEKPEALVSRLAKQKSEKLSKKYPNSLIITCDQVIAINDEILGKPKDHQDAVRQLQLCSGNKVLSLTALCVADYVNNKIEQTIAYYEVYFKKLTAQQIENYLQKDQPYQCAGSIQAEKCGPALFTKMAGDDFNALLGLPMIKLVDLLAEFHIHVI